jgi:predicted transcriptional regulator
MDCPTPATVWIDYPALKPDILQLWHELQTQNLDDASRKARHFVETNVCKLYYDDWERQFDKNKVVRPKVLTGADVQGDLRDSLIEVLKRIVWLAKEPCDAYQKIAQGACQDFLGLLGVDLTATQTPDPGAVEFPPVDDEDISILRHLEKESPRLCDQYDLEVNVGLARKTIGKRLEYLIDNGLVEQPKGERGGAAITAKGRALLQSLPPRSTR